MSPAETVTVQVFHLCRIGASGAVTVRFASGHSDVGYWWASGRWPALTLSIVGMQMAGAREVVEPPIHAELHHAARVAGFLTEG